MLDLISISFLLFLGIFLGVGIYSATRKKETSEDYLLAGRDVHPWLAALSAVATNNSGFMFIGLIGTTYSEGISAMWIMVGWVFGDYLTWIARVPDRVREESERRGCLTIPSFLGDGLVGGRVVVVVAGVITLAFLGLYSAAQLSAGSKALNILFGWDYNVGAILGAAIVVAYCFAGGIRASIWTDAVQSVVMLVAMALLFGMAVAYAGGLGSMWAALEKVDPQLVSVMPPDPKFGVALFVIGWFAAGIGVVGQPHIMVRTMTIDSVENVAVARRVYMTWNLIFAVFAVGVGVVSRAVLPELIGEAASFDPELAMPMLAKELLPSVLVGLCLAGLFAATMSTADSQILCCSAAITQDLFPQFGRSYAMVKMATLVVAVLSLVIALYAIALEKAGQDSGVFALVVLAWASLASGLGPLLVLRAFGRMMPGWVGLSIMLSGIAAVLIWRYALEFTSAIYDVLPGMAAGFLVYALWSLTLGSQQED